MIIIIILYIVALVILLSLSSFLVYKMINSNRSSPDEFIGLLTVLSSQIQTELDAYREFNSDSFFRIGGEFPMMTDAMIEDDMEFLDISYNYINVIMPTIQATF